MHIYVKRVTRHPLLVVPVDLHAPNIQRSKSLESRGGQINVEFCTSLTLIDDGDINKVSFVCIEIPSESRKKLFGHDTRTADPDVLVAVSSASILIDRECNDMIGILAVGTASTLAGVIVGSCRSKFCENSEDRRKKNRVQLDAHAYRHQCWH